MLIPYYEQEWIEDMYTLAFFSSSPLLPEFKLIIYFISVYSYIVSIFIFLYLAWHTLNIFWLLDYERSADLH